MLWAVIVVLVVLWFIGLVLSVFEGLIHLLLLVALGILLYNLVSDRSAA